MSRALLCRLVGRYRWIFEIHGIPPRREAIDVAGAKHPEMLRHAHWVVVDIEERQAQEEVGNLVRQLVAVQGILWLTGMRSLEEMLSDIG